MPKYVVLANWTDEGVRTAEESIARSENIHRLAEQLGGRIELLLWTQGRYDLASIIDMPDDEAAAALALKIGASGTARTETLRGFTADEFGRIFERFERAS